MQSKFWLWAGWAFLIIVTLGIVFPAAAQTSGRVVTGEVSPLVAYGIDTLLAIFGPLIVAVVLAVLGRLWTLLGLKQTEAHRATVEQVLQRSLELARARFGQGDSLVIPRNMRNSAIQFAAENAIDKGPQALKRFGVKRHSDAKLHEMIEARLPDLMDPFARVSGPV